MEFELKKAVAGGRQQIVDEMTSLSAIELTIRRVGTPAS